MHGFVNRATSIVVRQKYKAEWQNKRPVKGHGYFKLAQSEDKFSKKFYSSFSLVTPAQPISDKIVMFYMKISFLSKPINRATTAHGCPDCTLHKDAWSTGRKQAEIQQCHSSHAVFPGPSFMRQEKMKALISNFSKGKIDTICRLLPIESDQNLSLNH